MGRGSRLKRIAVKNDIFRREIVKRRSRLEPCSDEPVVGSYDARVGRRSLGKICAARTVEYDLFGVMVARRWQVSDHGRKCCDRIGGVEFRDRSYKPSIGSDLAVGDPKQAVMKRDVGKRPL